jgi:hypothetical protein
MCRCLPSPSNPTLLDSKTPGSDSLSAVSPYLDCLLPVSQGILYYLLSSYSLWFFVPLEAAFNFRCCTQSTKGHLEHPSTSKKKTNWKLNTQRIRKHWRTRKVLGSKMPYRVHWETGMECVRESLREWNSSFSSPGEAWSPFVQGGAPAAQRVQGDTCEGWA